MPTLVDERALAPRSAVARFKPNSTNQERNPVISRRSRIDARETTAPHLPDDLEEEDLSYRRAAAPSPRRASTAPLRPRRRFHPLFFIGVGFLIMIFGWIALNALGSWWQTTQDDWRYGRPRTFQVDAVVGHHDSPQNPSHFIAMNLNRQIVVIEIPGGDVAHSTVYRGPVLLGPGQDLTPVTLSFQDVNHDGKPDMVIMVAGNRLVWTNVNGTFVPPTPNQSGIG